jgi:hypothetical protein
MPRGGYRPGSGPKKGSKQSHTREIEARLKKLNCDPIEGLVAIAQDTTTSKDTRARVLIELASYCYAKQRPEPQRRPIALGNVGDTLEAQGRAVLGALRAGDLSADEGAQLLQALAKQAETEKVGILADIVAKLAADRGIELPAELRLRSIPRTLPGTAS